MDRILLLVSKALKSKTLIVNYAALAAATLTLWVNHDALAEYPEVVAAMGSVLAGINIVLRLVTNKPLEQK